MIDMEGQILINGRPYNFSVLGGEIFIEGQPKKEFVEQLPIRDKLLMVISRDIKVRNLRPVFPEGK